MEIIFTPQAFEDMEFWKSSGNKFIMNKISLLLKDMSAHPFSWIGKPEALKYVLRGKWSRRINSEHRIIYSVDDKKGLVYVFALRYHYIF